MFFSISKNSFNDAAIFSEHFLYNNLYVSLDKGWNYKDSYLYKGYCLGNSLEDKVNNKNFNEEQGNYCIIDFSLDEVKFYTDDTRSFQFFYNENIVTNLPTDDLTPIYFNGTIRYESGSFLFVKNPDSMLKYDPTRKYIPKDKLVDILCEHLVNAAQNLRNDIKLIGINSGGYDTALMRSAFDYIGKPYDLKTQLVPNNLSYINSAYDGFYLGDEPHIQLTGYSPESIFSASTMTDKWFKNWGQYLLNPHNIDLDYEFKRSKNGYRTNYYHMLRKKYGMEVNKPVKYISPKKTAFLQVSNIVLNIYYSIWHYNDILTFTPLRSKELLNNFLYADADALLSQMIYADINREAIKRLSPTILNSLDDEKKSVWLDS